MGESILKTLIELLEDQEHIKVTYTLGGKTDGTVPTPARGA